MKKYTTPPGDHDACGGWGAKPSRCRGPPTCGADHCRNKLGHQWAAGATYALKRFREVYLPVAIKLMPSQSFYSLRHSWRDALRRIDAPESTLEAVGGWGQGKTSDAYGDKFDPDYQVKVIEKISFEGLNLSALHHQLGSFSW